MTFRKWTAEALKMTACSLTTALSIWLALLATTYRELDSAQHRLSELNAKLWSTGADANAGALTRAEWQLTAIRCRDSRKAFIRVLGPFASQAPEIELPAKFMPVPTEPPRMNMKLLMKQAEELRLSLRQEERCRRKSIDLLPIQDRSAGVVKRHLKPHGSISGHLSFLVQHFAELIAQSSPWLWTNNLGPPMLAAVSDLAGELEDDAREAHDNHPGQAGENGSACFSGGSFCCRSPLALCCIVE